VDDDGNSLRVIVIEEFALTLVVWFGGTLTTDGLIVLPGRPSPLDEESVTLRKSGVGVLDTGIGLVIATLLHLHDSVTPLLHLFHEIDSTTTIVVRGVRNSLLLEGGHETPE
jgi:hypothetical protein